MSDELEKSHNFLGRWSERKTAERKGEPLIGADIPEQSEVGLPSPAEEISDEDMPIPDDLPDIETLDKDSDYTLFMRKGTPEHLKRLALKKLFHSDPALAVLDGLNDYDEDYSMIGMVAEAVSTRYKPGRGMVDPEDEIVEDEVDETEDEEEAVRPIEEEIAEIPNEEIAGNQPEETDFDDEKPDDA